MVYTKYSNSYALLDLVRIKHISVKHILKLLIEKKYVTILNVDICKELAIYDPKYLKYILKNYSELIDTK